MGGYARSSIVLWASAPLLLWLSLYRPFTATQDRAARMPRELGGFVVLDETEMTARHFELLGTDDATWRTYRAPDGEPVFLVAVFHQENWKSVHPPHICLRGSDMQIVEDGSLATELAGVPVDVGRIVARSNQDGREYLSLYAFVADGFVTESYAAFFVHHAPRALFRISEGGFLIRVETWIGASGVAAAERRCVEFLRWFVPAGQALLR